MLLVLLFWHVCFSVHARDSSSAKMFHKQERASSSPSLNSRVAEAFKFPATHEGCPITVYIRDGCDV